MGDRELCQRLAPEARSSSVSLAVISRGARGVKRSDARTKGEARPVQDGDKDEEEKDEEDREDEEERENEERDDEERKRMTMKKTSRMSIMMWPGSVVHGRLSYTPYM